MHFQTKLLKYLHKGKVYAVHAEWVGIIALNILNVYT
jgi:hypothetical protein